MGREGENLPLARASRPSVADALQGVECHAWRITRAVDCRSGTKGQRPWCSPSAGRAHRDRRELRGADLRTALSRASAPPSGGRVACVAGGDHQIDDTRLMEQLATLDNTETGTIENVADAILHDLLQVSGENPKVARVTIAAIGAELVAFDDGLDQRGQRGHPQRALEGELRE